MILVLAVILGLTIYLIPSFVASGKKHAAGIVVLNIFFGWSLIGWVAALIWALCSERIK